MKKSHLTEILACIVVFLAVVLAAFSFREWKKGEERAGCLINIRNVQQAVRGCLGMNQGRGLDYYTPDYMRKTIFTGPDPYLRYPVCPSGGTYTFHDLPAINPPLGFVFLTCSCAETHNHKPDDSANW